MKDKWQDMLIPEHRNSIAACYDTHVRQSKWSDTEAFQAILKDGHQVLLTAYSTKNNEKVCPVHAHMVNKGTMWGYETAYRIQQWVAASEKEGIRYTHEQIQGMPVNAWIGYHCQVGDP